MASVVEDGPAAKAGIQEGDVITKLGDDEISSADGLIIALRSHEVGEKVEITLMRGKEEKKVTVELGSDEELQNQQQDDSSTDTGNGGITDEQLRSTWRSCWASKVRVRATVRVSNEPFRTCRSQRAVPPARDSPSFRSDPLGMEENGSFRTGKGMV